MIFSADVVSKGAAFFFNLIFMYVGKKETPLGNDIRFLIGVLRFLKRGIYGKGLFFFWT